MKQRCPGPGQCWLSIAVYGASWLGASTYSVSATSPNAPEALVPDILTRGTVPPNMNRLYSLAVPAGTTNISVSLTALTGYPGELLLYKTMLEAPAPCPCL